MFAESREPKLRADIDAVNLTCTVLCTSITGSTTQHVIFAAGLANRSARGEIPAFLVRIGGLKLAYGRHFDFLIERGWDCLERRA